MDDDKEQLIKAIVERLSESGDVVTFSATEAKELREILVFYQQAKLLRVIVSYMAIFLAAYLAFKADLISLFNGGDK